MLSIREFTLQLHQKGNTVSGTSISGFDVAGEVDGMVLRLRMCYRGFWRQTDEGWAENDYSTMIEIVAQVTNQGNRLEVLRLMMYVLALDDTLHFTGPGCSVVVSRR